MTFDPTTDFAQDYVILAGKKSPGLCRISKAGIPFLWDKAQGYGLSGAVLRFRGLDLSEFDITLRFWEPQHFADWEAFRPVVAAPPQGRYPKAIDAWHPILEACGIKSIVVKNVGQLEKVDEKGEWNIVISCSAYRKPKRTLAKPEGSKVAAPVDPADQMIADLTSQVQELAK